MKWDQGYAQIAFFNRDHRWSDEEIEDIVKDPKLYALLGRREIWVNRLPGGTEWSEDRPWSFTVSSAPIESWLPDASDSEKRVKRRATVDGVVTKTGLQIFQDCKRMDKKVYGCGQCPDHGRTCLEVAFGKPRAQVQEYVDRNWASVQERLTEDTTFTEIHGMRYCAPKHTLTGGPLNNHFFSPFSHHTYDLEKIEKQHKQVSERVAQGNRTRAFVKHECGKCAFESCGRWETTQCEGAFPDEHKAYCDIIERLEKNFTRPERNLDASAELWQAEAACVFSGRITKIGRRRYVLGGAFHSGNGFELLVASEHFRNMEPDFKHVTYAKAIELFDLPKTEKEYRAKNRPLDTRTYALWLGTLELQRMHIKSGGFVGNVTRRITRRQIEPGEGVRHWVAYSRGSYESYDAKITSLHKLYEKLGSVVKLMTMR